MRKRGKERRFREMKIRKREKGKEARGGFKEAKVGGGKGEK